VEYMDISMQYLPYVTPAFTMTAEINGQITQQNLSPTRHRDNWELALSAEQGTLSQTLRTQGHDEAFLELVGGMEMDYDPAGIMATIRPSLALQAGLGPYTFALEQVGPNHFSQTLSLNAISGEFESDGRKVRFSADVSFKVDVIVNPGALPGEPERIPVEHKTGNRVFPTIKERVVGALPTKTELAYGGIFIVGIVLLSFAPPAAIAATGVTAGGLVNYWASEVPNIKRGPHRHVIHTHDSGRIY